MDATRGITASDVLTLPAHLLSAAFLVGSIPFRACRSDPRVLYTLYIPPKRYAAVHESLQSSEAIDSIERLPLIVNVHGTRRSAERCRDSMKDFADEHGIAILAPLFPAGLDGFTDLDSYKLLRSKTLQSDLILIDILNEISHIWPGIRAETVTLMGFSGGGQFVHRFAYIHPELVNALVIGAPGRTTELSDRPWPIGIQDVSEIFDGAEVDIEDVKSIKHVLMIVGEEDALPEGAAEVQAMMAKRLGKNDYVKSLTVPRTESLTELHRDWKNHGITSDLKLVPGVGHSSLEVLPYIIDWLSKCPAIRHVPIAT